MECNDRPVDYFSRPAAYITHNATSTLSDIIMASFIRLHVALNFCITHAILLPNTCKHNSMFKMGRVTL